MNNNKSFKNNFFKRTYLYFFIGIFCISLDNLIFLFLSKIIETLKANSIAYLIGSISSYKLNKSFTFKSKNSALSLRRFFVVILIGFLISQIVIYFGVYIFSIDKIRVKLLATLISVSIQYLLNTFFSNKLTSNEKRKKKYF